MCCLKIHLLGSVNLLRWAPLPLLKASAVWLALLVVPCVLSCLVVHVVLVSV
jgi:hypothetical protein